MVVTELHVSSHIIPWEHVLPDVDPRGLTAGRAKALLRQKLCISSRGLELLLGGWLPLLEDQNVQDLYARYHQTAVLQSDGTFCTIIYDSCLHESAEVAFDVDTGRLFYNARKKPAAKKLRDEDELAPLCVLDKLVLQIRVRRSVHTIREEDQTRTC